MTSASLSLEAGTEGRRRARLGGDWTLVSLTPHLAQIQAQLAGHGRDPALEWDLTGVGALDSVGAMLLWHAWGRRLPAQFAASETQRGVLARISAALAEPEGKPPAVKASDLLARAGWFGIKVVDHAVTIVALIGQLLLDGLHCLRHPADMPWRETSANLFKAGARAMPVAALVGFLIGVTLSYLSALQLSTLGAENFIVNILGLGIVRELGPVLVAVLVAGRSGSAMTAQLGVMRVTEEIDALATMGVSRTVRLVLPKVTALAIAMPLLVLWTDVTALTGGMIAAQIQLDISYGYFIEELPKAVPVANLWIGLAKGAVFGFLIALVACHFGLRVRPNTESLSANTTRSVVTAITVVILVDAVFAIATRSIGLPV